MVEVSPTMNTENESSAPLVGDSYRTFLVQLVDAYMAAKGMKADTSLSRLIFGADKDFISNLRRGDNFTLKKGLRLEKWLRANMPEIPEDADATSVGD